MATIVMNDETRIERVTGGLYNGTVGFTIYSMTLEEAKTIFSNPAKTKKITNYLTPEKTETYEGFTRLLNAHQKLDGSVKIFLIKGAENSDTD